MNSREWTIYLAAFAGISGAALFFGKKRMSDIDVPGMAASEKYIGQLDLSLQAKAHALLIRAAVLGIPLVVTQGYRDPKEQARLYAQGRTAPGPIVTNAPPGSSWHEYRLAFDVAVLAGGKPTWPNDVKLWDRIGAVGKSLGLTWGGDFASIKDRPHFEYHPGFGLAEARQGRKPVA